MDGFVVLRDKTINESDIDDKDEKSEVTLGAKLRSARETRGLSIGEVADKLRLKYLIIESFENDIFTFPDLPVAFTKGYLRSYVRFLKLPEELLLHTNCGSTKTPKLNSMHIRENPKSKCGWIKGITVLILLVAFGMTLLSWWQNYQQEQQKRDLLVSSVTELSATQESNSVAEQSVPIQNQSIEQPTQEISDKDPVTTDINSENEVSSNKDDAMNESMQKSNTEKVQDEESVDVKNVSEPESKQIKEDNTSKRDVVVSESEEPKNVLLQKKASEALSQANNVKKEDSTEVIESKNELRVEVISASSWITIYGDNEKTLTSKLYKAGKVLTFDDNKNYKLVIGAPVNVKVHYKGKTIPLKLDGRVSRITLP
ncbi:RodZ domain-containing protein [Phocoenobacter skyensis]|uniref:Cytoskeleton protein RodZ n=1 Tax=Phocoenobacter skyensis TaxID=97481 RepID=A0A1H7UUV9_9PAST|nr:RodZ domain-containing protein [Pasteurella skyensis]MDP8078585.1 DUF4115 domain-containing protein [Pasteurella skyensis]MDP8084323.1 DUF4115 domain-containing protein [Pasteurella skyensis]MDP8170613.1 DUF4115 domain-containing protein [Pasteurella skyensis]MDP8174770.1 DUF4115 domain-containing protein [Pasteurella skyensis]MDP8184655.1 DUF4115 domain-containing protein [Pasteurella skyensis]